MTPCYFFCQPLCLTKGGSSASKQDFICRGVFCPENDDGPFWLFSFKASLEVVSVSHPSKTVKRFEVSLPVKIPNEGKAVPF